MKKNFVATLLLSAAFLFAAEQNARDIMVKVKNRPDGDTRSSSMEMKLVNKSGNTRVRKITSYAMDVGEDTKTIMFFQYPNDVKGTGFLTVNYDDVNKEDDKWLYLPALKKTRRISGKSSKTDYFMGSDFTYDDIGKRNVDEDTHKLLREESVDGFDYYVIESTPKKDGEIFSKKLVWIRKDCDVVAKVEFYDKLGKLHRQMVSSDIKKVDGFWTVGKMEMKNVQMGHSTELLFLDPKYNIQLDSKIFSVNKLERGL
ncbi:MAG: outer membrane lipoprotein-sorting protein [Fibrobacter sp.]|nr:outer membrane lipoprotein-sorting protein [Fibrobacter sp.]